MRDLAQHLNDYPELKLILTTKQKKLLAVPAEQPFANDLEYLEAMEALINLSGLVADKQCYLRNRYIDSQDSMQPAMDIACRDKMTSLRDDMEILCEKRLVRMVFKPRILRLAEKLELTKKETRALVVILLFNADKIQTRSLSDSRVSSMAVFSGMDNHEVLAFFSSERRHIKEDLLVPGDIWHNVFKNSINMTNVIVRALYGAVLPIDEFMSIDNSSALAEAIREEPEFSRLYAENLPRFSVDNSGATGQEDNEQDDMDTVDLSELLASTSKTDTETVVVSDQAGDEISGDTAITPYSNNFEYLEDRFKLIATTIKLRMEQLKDADEYNPIGTSKESAIRRYSAKKRTLENKCHHRLQMTLQQTKLVPRLELLAKALNLNEFEKNIILTLVGGDVSLEVCEALSLASQTHINVQGCLIVFGNGLKDRINKRKYFYKNSRLVREGILTVTSDFTLGLSHSNLSLDPRIYDFILGIDSELSQLVDGSHLYQPSVDIDKVILPDDSKNLIINTAKNYKHYQQAMATQGFDDIITYGKSLVMLFYGSSGTGKTMLANAIASHLGKKVLLVNFPNLGGSRADANLRQIFREAKIHDAIVFFDECDAIFEARIHGNAEVGLLLTSIERHEGMVIMATNRPHDLDEAMHRRITLAIEFREPDQHLREKIWRGHLPAKVNLAADVDLAILAKKFELSGGYIKNAVLSALSIAVTRSADNICICQADLEQGARLQVRGRLKMTDFDRRIIPGCGFDSLILPKSQQRSVTEIIEFEKSRNVLFGQWGFGESSSYGHGTTVLLYGPPGTGKTLACEAVGFETGKPLMVVNTAEIISKYVGETSKNIESIFKEAKNNNSILVFDDAESLFGHRSNGASSTTRYANHDVGILLHHMERFPGVVILTTNNWQHIDEAFFRRFRFVIEFSRPDKQLRQKLWQQLIPARVPLHSDIDFAKLASAYDIAGGNIKNAIFRAAARVAGRNQETRILRMADLNQAAAEEADRFKQQGMGFLAA